MKVTIRKDYRYYLPFIFGSLIFIVIFYYLVLNNSKTLQSAEQVLGQVKNGDKLITDPKLAKIAQNDPLILAQESDRLKDFSIKEPVVKIVEIKDASNLAQIIDPNTIITFKNATDSVIKLIGAENTWQAEIKVGESYSQMFEKTGQFKFTINGQPIGVIRVR